ncbi:unnamed protein product [Penicillium glandicola]
MIPCGREHENMQHMHLGSNANDAHGLGEFTERILQARLANFWRSMGPTLGSTYDVIVAEERYEKLCIILLDASHLPKYKQVLLSSQQKALAVAALYVLQGVSRLHSLIGGSQTRYTGVIQPTFEAAVVLVSLLINQSFLGEVESQSSRITNVDPLRAGMANLTRAGCMKAIRDALSLLRMLAEVSNVADVGARNLAKLVHKVGKQSTDASEMESPSKPEDGAFSQAGRSSTEINLPEYSDSNPAVSLAELVSVAASDVDMNLDWDALCSNI